MKSLFTGMLLAAGIASTSSIASDLGRLNITLPSTLGYNVRGNSTYPQITVANIATNATIYRLTSTDFILEPKQQLPLAVGNYKVTISTDSRSLNPYVVSQVTTIAKAGETQELLLGYVFNHGATPIEFSGNVLAANSNYWRFRSPSEPVFLGLAPSGFSLARLSSNVEIGSSITGNIIGYDNQFTCTSTLSNRTAVVPSGLSVVSINGILAPVARTGEIEVGIAQIDLRRGTVYSITENSTGTKVVMAERCYPTASVFVDEFDRSLSFLLPVGDYSISAMGLTKTFSVKKNTTTVSR